MRRPLLIVAAGVGALILIVTGVLIYAVLNLNSIIARNRGALLSQASGSLGREVKARDIAVTLGWGIMMDLKGVEIADDPAVSQLPFVKAGDVFVKVEFLPLLSSRLEMTRVELSKPEIRIIRTATGKLNVSTIGSKPAPGELSTEEARPGGRAGEGPANLEAPPRKPNQPASGVGGLGWLSVGRFAIRDGKLSYEDRKAGGSVLTVGSIDLSVDDFTIDAPFRVALAMAVLGNEQNLKLSATVGPLVRDGAFDADSIPLSARALIGPLTLDRLKSFAPLEKSIPSGLSLTDTVRLEANLTGSLNSLQFRSSSNLTSNRISFGEAIAKPAGVVLKVSASGERRGGKLLVEAASLQLASLKLKAGRVRFGGGRLSARIDTNRFDFASIVPLVPMLTRYGVKGFGEIHSGIALIRGKPQAMGKISLEKVSFSPTGRQAASVTDLSGAIKLSGNSADVGPLRFNLGSGRARLELHSASLAPLEATYKLSVDRIKLKEVVPSRDPDDLLAGFSSSGSVLLRPGGPLVKVTGSSTKGRILGVSYGDLGLTMALEGKRLDISRLKLSAFGGTISMSGRAAIGGERKFKLKLETRDVDLHQVLLSQKSKAASTVRGRLVATIEVSGAGTKFDDIKPTLSGAGQLKVTGGKLVGVNLVASALKKTRNVPGIGDLVPASVVKNHPRLFDSPDTDIETLRLSFQLKGPRITSRDITIKSADYRLFGDGWFDVDRNVDLKARILLSGDLSKEVQARKKNVVYLMNRQGEIEIPLQIVGRLPKPRVLPDTRQLAERAGKRLFERKGRKAVEKFLEKKGLGGLLGGGSTVGSGASPSGQKTPAPALPDLLKKLF